jgi:hypothetical protein
MIDEFLKTRAGIIILSVIWGLGLATLFKQACDGPGCKVIEYRGPPLSETKYAWQYGDGKCYQIKPVITRCHASATQS